MLISYSDTKTQQRFIFNSDHLILIEPELNNPQQTILWFTGIGLHSRRTIKVSIATFQSWLSAALGQKLYEYEKNDVYENQAKYGIYMTPLVDKDRNIDGR